jgi:hypothetical protein
LHTVIVEIEEILNSRPISYLNSDDVEEPLTPSHLLVGCRILNLSDNLAHYEEFEITTEVLWRKAKQCPESLLEEVEQRVLARVKGRTPPETLNKCFDYREGWRCCPSARSRLSTRLLEDG